MKPFNLLRRLLQVATVLLFMMQHQLIIYNIPIIVGSLVSSKVLNIIGFVDPTAAIEKLLAYKQPIVFPTIAFLTTLVLYLVLGRVFCGWICPLDIFYSYFRNLRRSRSSSHSRIVYFSLKFYIPMFVIIFGMSIFAYIPIYTNYLNVITMFSVIINLLSQIFSPTIAIPAKIEYAIIVILLTFILDIIVSTVYPRFWCRRICITGILYGTFNKLSLLTLKINDKLCTFCGRCDEVCRTSIPIISKYIKMGKDSIRDIDCIKCFECIEVCPTNALSLSFTSLRTYKKFSLNPIYSDDFFFIYRFFRRSLQLNS
ncbi:MAG: 4Fe-4S binding protein [Nitrososphaerota archaeon]